MNRFSWSASGFAATAIKNSEQQEFDGNHEPWLESVHHLGVPIRYNEVQMAQVREPIVLFGHFNRASRRLRAPDWLRQVPEEETLKVLTTCLRTSMRRWRTCTAQSRATGSIHLNTWWPYSNINEFMISNLNVVHFILFVTFCKRIAFSS